MKRTLMVATFLLTVGLVANAQEYKPFRLAVGLGYAMTSGEGASGGVLYAVEPGYRISDALLVSGRIEGAVVIRGLNEGVNGYDAKAAAIASYTANMIYYLSNEKFRPYVGAGLGIFSLAAVEVSDGQGALIEADTKFGFYPRVGFDLGHFNVNIDFNLIPKTDIPDSNFSTKNSYIGIRIGGFFFGGRN